MKIFVIVSRVPYPLDKGDKLRIYHQLKELSKLHQIFLCCLDDGNSKQESIDHLKTFCSQVEVFKLNRLKIYFNLFWALLSSKPFQVHYFYQLSIHKKIKKILNEFQPDRIFCQLIRTAEYVKNEHHILKTIDYMDAFSKGIDRRVPTSGVLKPIFKEEAKRLVKYEHLIFDYFDQHSIISEEDRSLIYHEKRKDIKLITNGIDTNFFRPIDTEKKFDLVFVGNMSYAPNISAVMFLVKEILPLLKIEVNVLIAGADPVKEVMLLSSTEVTVTGWLEDIRVAYLDAKVFVAPLFIGTGLQNKLLEAMAMELPCVTTDLVNSSLKATIDREIEIANSAEVFAAKITDLLSSKTKRKELGEKAREFVTKNYSWERSSKKLEQIITNKTG